MRYIVFECYAYYPSGGMEDATLRTNDISEVKERVEKWRDDRGSAEEYYDLHVYDTARDKVYDYTELGDRFGWDDLYDNEYVKIETFPWDDYSSVIERMKEVHNAGRRAKAIFDDEWLFSDKEFEEDYDEKWA